MLKGILAINWTMEAIWLGKQLLITVSTVKNTCDAQFILYIEFYAMGYLFSQIMIYTKTDCYNLP